MAREQGRERATAAPAGGRVFLGWDGPALPAAVAWLAEHFGEPRRWDLGGLVVAVPVARAGRRLLELLTERAGGGLTPPEIATARDRLPELLCPPPTDRRIAGDTRIMLTRVHVLREIGPDRLEDLLPSPPRRDDVLGWWRVADRLGRLGEELAAGGLTCDDVIARAERGDLELPGAARWHALAAIDRAVNELLEADGLIERQRHRLACVRQERCACDREIVLLATADLTPMARAMLEQVDGSVTPLVHAPESHAEGFDAFGAIEPAYWRDQPVELDEDALRIVPRTTDQPTEVVAAIEAMNGRRRADGHAALAADEVTVGLGDESHGGAIARAVVRAGAPARVAKGRDWAWTGPALLLSSLASFAEHRRLDAFAALLRHPDVAADLRQRLRGRDASADWLTLLDDYISRSLRTDLADEVLGDDEKFASLVRAYRVVADRLPDEPSARKALPEWAGTISAALGAFYEHRRFTRFDAEDHAAIGALEAIGAVLRDHAALDASHAVTPGVTLAEAMRLVHSVARSRTESIHAPGGEPAVELLGFLELALDDAPAVIVTSLNEHVIPASPRGDAFLPDTLRRALGLHDAGYRYARDKLLLLGATRGREHVTLIAPMRAAEGDPLTPSRLLLACDEATRTHRIRRFYDDELADAADAAPPRTLLAAGERSRFLIPHPERVAQAGGAPVIKKLSVTAFRDYLACPYRFYLRHVCRLEPKDDRAMELDALQFGTIAHEVLERFANVGPTQSAEPDEIADFLREALDESFHRAFGGRLRPALLIQHGQLLERLKTFAQRQAEIVSEGWRIAYVEQKLAATVAVGGHSVTLEGKIDRIDAHDDFGYRIIDYKTGDTGNTPQKSHRRRVRAAHRPAEEQEAEGWVDLQLPLYLDLAECELGLGRERVTLAQFNLPRKLEEVKLHVAEWDADLLAEAQRVRDWVIRQVCAGRFWPPQEHTGYPDGFAWLCADTTLDRHRLIQQSVATARGGDDGDA